MSIVNIVAYRLLILVEQLIDKEKNSHLNDWESSNHRKYATEIVISTLQIELTIDARAGHCKVLMDD